MKNMRTKGFQSGGGFVDEDELFDDGEGSAAAAAASTSALAGELADTGADDSGEDGDDGSQGGITPAPAATSASDRDVELTGVEQFLTAYGVQGGIITYEDGSSARFTELDASEQTEILSSLVSSSVPSIEERFNLDDDEINLLNVLRESDMSSEEFINSLVDYRMQALQAQYELRTTDYEALSAEAIFVKSRKDSNPDITDEELAAEIVQAQALPSYDTTVEALRTLYITQQAEENQILATQENEVFLQELEAQRHDIVSVVEGINDIGGANITDAMKEYLLHDMMELNSNKDPILMEKLFSSPEAMFKANWFLNYGENHMKETDAYWKKEVSKARKDGYLQATNGMPGKPMTFAGVSKGAADKGQGMSFGSELSEEELFDLKDDN